MLVIIRLLKNVQDLFKLIPHSLEVLFVKKILTHAYGLNSHRHPVVAT